ncbi:hypothetical protein HNR23_004903 [Nocardiopsis mwathae]|uniref:Uncharacterized protein n=1 Tax=Nocardiopsis mwathae TaxID=1472723 RepID=A0A7X0D7U8_9ACTN|nr:hypothetical protein [Nocardiopsis mwathae]MBB6174843.1 hypothetical protein [Nocardiopsis mwathae]
MTTLDVDNHGPGTVFAAESQVFYNGDEFIEIRPVSADEFQACEETRFVPPTGEWDETARKLSENRLLVLLGDLGSGRRTAALQRLRGLCETSRIYELEPVWSRPRDQLLPPVTRGNGYLLDMSEPTPHQPRSEFCKQLLHWVQKQEIYLIVTTTPEVWGDDRWAAGAEGTVARLGSPDARLLVERELRAIGMASRVAILSDSAFEPIWKSKPKAEGACRLAKIITKKAPDTDLPTDIANEYLDWREWIDKQLPDNLDARALLWSCAFCDGGKRKSVLRMAENLRRKLGQKRTAADILSDRPASKRLEDAKIERSEDVVRLAPKQHGLPAAVRRHLWDEYEDQVEVLKDWIVTQVASLPFDDAERVVDAVLSLVIEYRDDDLLKKLRDALTGARRPLAVHALSRAALDPRFGAHVRGRLYTWLAHSPSQELVDLVAEVCGGAFGEQKPTMALVRLRRAALKSQPGSLALANAFTNLATHYPSQVLGAIKDWFADSSSRKAAINAFLALASREQGARIIFGVSAGGVAEPDFRDSLVSYFQAALADSAAKQAANSVMEEWKVLAEEGKLDKRTTVEAFGMALAPWIKDNVMQRFLPDSTQLDMNSFWGRVLAVGIQQTMSSVSPETNADVLEG